jgi:predicted DNA-binding protein
MAESNKKKRYFPVRMQDKMYSRLESQSLYFGVSIATIVRTALQQYIDAHQNNSGE